MLFAVSALKGYAIEASDGPLGSVADVLFDDRGWRARWLVVDTGTWLTGRKVLLHPSSLGEPDHEHRELPVHLDKMQIRDSPDIERDAPVSAQMERTLYNYYGWDPLWAGGGFGGGAIASPLSGPPMFGAGPMRPTARLDAAPEEGDPHLRSANTVTGYHVRATDGAIGHVETLLIEDGDWSIRYLIVDTRDWWVGKHVLISPYAVTGIEWEERDVHLDLARARVEASPPWDPAAMIDQVYEKQLHQHYQWPGFE